MTGSHFPLIPEEDCRWCATIAESFKAAAKPIMKAKNEKMPTIKPLVNPLKTATMITIKNATSIIIYIEH